MFTVLIEGLDFYGYHGVSAEERAVGHRYRVDVSLEVSGSAYQTDSISDTVDYGHAASVVERVFREAQCQTVERLAAKMSDQLLRSFPMVQSATVSVRKPEPPMPFVAASAGARVTATRAS